MSLPLRKLILVPLALLAVVSIAMTSNWPAQAATVKTVAKSAAATNMSSDALRSQFKPSKNDGDGDDDGTPLPYHWNTPKYSRDERCQIGGIALFLTILAVGHAWYGRSNAAREQQA